MTIKDIIEITGGRTKVIIIGIDEKDKYSELWRGQIDDINFNQIPYGNYEVQHITVINGEDNLELYIEMK